MGNHGAQGKVLHSRKFFRANGQQIRWIAPRRSPVRVRLAPSRKGAAQRSFSFGGIAAMEPIGAPFQALVPEIAAIAADRRGFAPIPARFTVDGKWCGFRSWPEWADALEAVGLGNRTSVGE
jgi:hypothetical protein